MTSVLLREATADDCDVLLRLIRELALYEKREHVVTADANALRQGLFGSRPYAFALLAESGGIAVGFCLYFYNFSTFLGRPGIYIEDIYVRESHRGLGIGRRFFARIAQIAREKRCGRIEWAVLDWNKPALDFYRKISAEPVAGWTIHRLTEPQFETFLLENA